MHRGLPCCYRLIWTICSTRGGNPSPHRRDQGWAIVSIWTLIFTYSLTLLRLCNCRIGFWSHCDPRLWPSHQQFHLLLISPFRHHWKHLELKDNGNTTTTTTTADNNTTNSVPVAIRLFCTQQQVNNEDDDLKTTATWPRPRQWRTTTQWVNDCMVRTA
jgi:hypothetical protein